MLVLFLWGKSPLLKLEGPSFLANQTLDLNLAKVLDSPKKPGSGSSSSCATLKTGGNNCKIGVPLLGPFFRIFTFSQ
jgi:hypothetical protein